MVPDGALPAALPHPGSCSAASSRSVSGPSKFIRHSAPTWAGWDVLKALRMITPLVDVKRSAQDSPMNEQILIMM